MDVGVWVGVDWVWLFFHGNDAYLLDGLGFVFFVYRFCNSSKV